MLAVFAALTVHPGLGLLLVKGERDGDELVLVVAVAVVAGYYNTRIADLHLRLSIFGDGVYAEQTKHPFEVRTERNFKRKAAQKQA